jgi:hypothetical protein
MRWEVCEGNLNDVNKKKVSKYGMVWDEYPVSSSKKRKSREKV